VPQNIKKMNIRKYTEEEKEIIHDIKERTIGSCKKCFCGWVDDDILSDGVACNCRKVFIYLKELTYSGIPKEYWHLNFKNLKLTPSIIKTMFQKYINNLNTAVEKGLGLCFFGSNGLGKTSLLVEIGKEAVIAGYNVVYTTTQNWVEYKMTDNQYNLDRISEAKIILLDEIDKPYRKRGSDFVISSLENFFRNELPKNKIVNLATNWNKKQMIENLGDSVWSIILRKNKPISLMGEDKSERINDEWEEKLTSGSIDYLSDYFIEMANRMRRFEKTGNRKN